MTLDEHLEEIVARLRDARRAFGNGKELDAAAAKADIMAALAYFRTHILSEHQPTEQRRAQRAAYRTLVARVRKAEEAFEGLFKADLDGPLVQAWEEAAGEGVPKEEVRQRGREAIGALAKWSELAARYAIPSRGAPAGSNLQRLVMVMANIYRRHALRGPSAGREVVKDAFDPSFTGEYVVPFAEFMEAVLPLAPECGPVGAGGIIKALKTLRASGDWREILAWQPPTIPAAEVFKDALRDL
jgi:hypothetical protein